MSSLLLRALLVWIVFLPIAFANGAIRDFWYKPKLGNLAAHQVSTVVAIVLFAALSVVMLKSYATSANSQQLFIAGLMMVTMTIVFEFGFGHFIRGMSWADLARDYNLLQGRVWGVFLLSMLCSPYFVKLIEGSVVK